MILIRFTKMMIFATILAVVYIHMQMQIIQLAYVGKAKEKKIKKMVEVNNNLMHDILMLKSANNLGTEMFTEKSQMKFVDPESIVKLQAPEDILGYRIAQNAKEEDRSFGQILNFLSMGSRAEARMDR